MNEEEIKRIADEADMIVAGYAFTKSDDGTINVVYLYNTDMSCVINKDGNIIDSTMNWCGDMCVQNYYRINKQFLEDNANE